MRKEMIVSDIVARVIAMSIWTLVGVTVAFSSRMPLAVAVVLRTICTVWTIYAISDNAATAFGLLKQLWQKPKRRHVTVDLKRGTITETKD